MTVKVRLYPTNPHTPAEDPTLQPRGGDSFFDSVPKSRIFEVALLSALFFDPSGNVPSPTAVRGGDAFFDAAPKSRVVEVAILEGTNLPLPATTVAVVRGGDSFFDVAPKSRIYEIALLDGAPLPVFQVPSPVTPQGWPAVFPERFAVKFPPKLQDFGGYPVAGSVPSPTTPQGWQVQWPDRFAGKFPASLQLVSGDTWIGSVPTAFVGNAWVAAWDGPSRARFPAPAQLFSAFPQYQVATATTPQGWGTVAPDSFFRKGVLSHTYDAPYLTAATVVVVAPQGWSVWSPERFAKPLPAALQRFEAFQPQGTIVSVTPQGWAVSFHDARRPPGGIAAIRLADDPLTVASTPSGFSVGFPDILGARRPVAQSASVDIAALASNPQGWQGEFAAARRVARPVARPNDGSAFLAPPPSGNVPSPTTPQGWTPIFPERFAVPVRASLQLFQFMHWWQTVQPASIIAQPTLRGTDTAPTLLGTDASPSLSGKLALTINLTGKVGA